MYNVRRLNRSMMFNVTKFAAKVTIETKIEEFFSDSDEPVSLNMNVTKLGIDNTPVKRLKNRFGMVIAKARFACGVPEINIFSDTIKLILGAFDETYKNL